MSIKAYRILKKVDIVVGYKTYIELVEELISENTVVHSSGMKQEMERANKAIDFAHKGKKVAIISSGDPGVYGMAGLVLEIINKENFKLEFEVIPGITAANAAAAGLGAPLMHDYCVISLSDLLTPWSIIKKRLQQAARGDLIVVLYNPKSKKRVRPLKEAQKILLKNKNFDTPVGIVKNAKRGKERTQITTLENMLDKEIDMLTTVIIGNESTYISETVNKTRLMITPRGYNL
ncbi:MAG: precorrin-3B C(17)-methyltransferase [Bacillota bacterium]